MAGGSSEAPYLIGVAIRNLRLRFTRPVTFLVGENGTGKSTLIDPLAELCGLPASGEGARTWPGTMAPRPRRLSPPP